MKHSLIALTLLSIPLLHADDYLDHFNRGNQAFKNGDYIVAVDEYKEAIAQSSETPQPYFNLGLVYEQLNNEDKAIKSYQRAITLKQDYAKAHERLGKLLQKKEQIDDAINHLRFAVDYDQSKADLALEVARLFVHKEDFVASLPYYAIGVRAKPDDIVARFEYANALNTANKTEQALEHYLLLLKTRPTDSSILYNTAYTYKKLGKLSQAMPYYNAALKKNPEHAEAHFSLGLAHLIEGNFKEGWQKYEWRWQRGTQLSPRDFKQPRWNGEQLDGKTILIHAEQGLGDTFQFIRYAQIIKEQYGGHVIVAVQHPLHVLAIRCCPYIDKVIPLAHMYNEECDVQIPMLSIPLVLNTEEHTVPSNIPYIFPEPALITYWGQKLVSDPNFKVGICWQGNSKYSSPFLRSVVAAKSVALDKFKPLLNTPGVSFYSLQKQTGEDQLHKLTHLNIKTFDEDFDDKHGRFMDTAAVIHHLDLVITIDTSISHLSGAIGKPVWIMIPEPPDWRWMLERDNTPWYPENMRLFRQQTHGDWDGVIATIHQELIRVLKTKAPLIEHTNTVAGSIENSPRTTVVIEHNKVTNSSFTRQQLEHELAGVNDKLFSLSPILKSAHASPDNEQFMQHIRNYYMLTEIRSQLQGKLSALEGV